MNLIFPPIGRNARTTPLTANFAVMLVGIAARQAVSPTAMFFASRAAENAHEAALLAPAHGAFNQAMAGQIRRWKEP
ncbi:MAG: hypothetical protein ACTHKR_06165 [Sphingomonas sp.]